MSKYTAYQLKKRVKEILIERGYSFAFSETDFFWYKRYTKNSEGDRAENIAQYFMTESYKPSDFAEYVF